MLSLVLDDIGLSEYVNAAEIVADSADAYSTATNTVVDADSPPDADMANDAMRATDDVDIDQIPGDEDDHDQESLDVTLIFFDNVPTPDLTIELPATGGQLRRPLAVAVGLILLGLFLAGLRRRRPVAAG
jgi:LPXTG-motif cell wall-anchored protein